MHTPQWIGRLSRTRLCLVASAMASRTPKRPLMQRVRIWSVSESLPGLDASLRFGIPVLALPVLGAGFTFIALYRGGEGCVDGRGSPTPAFFTGSSQSSARPAQA
jgi:hypothetical protein